MRQITNKNTLADLSYLGFKNSPNIYCQLSPGELINHSLNNGEGNLCGNDALAIDTGEFTGRSPKDRFIVRDEITDKAVWWGDVNIPFAPDKFDALYNKVIDYLNDKRIYVRDSTVCADPAYMVQVRTITEFAFQCVFASNMFIETDEAGYDQPEWTIVAAPGFKANPKTDGTRQHNFSIINFSRKIILIGGTGYTGEIKKGMFSVLNFLLPKEGVLPMHCSANKGKDGSTAIFFGLSGTGKTTLSADCQRELIGDDEHGWGDHSIFNFEGGCYAKCAGLSPESEPEIYKAVRWGALLENVNFYPGTNMVDFNNISKTENTRVSYPLHYIDNASDPAIGNTPDNIFFLTADAFGVLPPISKLDTAQALYYFLSGYTAKVAGTEHGINEPQATFSSCFGKAFLPLHPSNYASLLKEKLQKHSPNVWLINTGWTGGAYGTGERIKLRYTRAMVRAALDGSLGNVAFQRDPVFGLRIPASCPGVPSEILKPANTWASTEKYNATAAKLVQLFKQNFGELGSMIDSEIVSAGPKL